MKNTVNKKSYGYGKVAIVFGDCTLGVKSGNTHYIFLIQEADWNRSIKTEKNGYTGKHFQFFGEQRPIMTEVADLDLNPVCG